MDLNKFYAQEYDPTKSYSKNDRCVYNGEWYECLDNTTGEFDTTKWKKRYLVEYIGGGTSASGNTWQEWAKAGGVDTSLYSSLDDLLADEVAIRRLMTVHASADYLLNWVSKEPTIMSTFIADTNAMKWIGLRDYICDKLMAIDTVKTAMLSSVNWEYILKDHVPVMTDGNKPYGEVSGSSSTSGYQGWTAFKGLIEADTTSTGWSPNTTTAGENMGYMFTNPTKVNSVGFIHLDHMRGYDYSISFKVQASDDNTNWEDLTETLSAKADELKYFTFNNDTYYLYYRVLLLGATPSTYSIQSGYGYRFNFYGRSLNVSVPTMTSNTAPWGEVSASSVYSSNYEAWRAFTPTVSDVLRWVTPRGTDTAWINYNFNKKVVVKIVAYVSSYIVVENKTGYAILQGSNDGVSWDDIQIISLDNLSLSPKFNNVNNDKAYQYYRMNITNANIYANSSNYCGFSFLQFYGVDYSEREYAQSSTMKYLYDHGVELVPIDTYTTNTGVVEKRDNEIYLYQGTNAQSNANIHTQSSIDLSPYSIERCIVGDEFIQNSATSSHWLGYANNTTGNAIGYSYIYPYIPNHAYIDVSSVNGVYYPTIAQNNINTSKTIITEWWLE